MLGFLLLVVWLFFVWMVIWTAFYPELFLFGRIPAPVELDRNNWLFAIGVVTAMSGWVVSSYITLRNSIKQHTINTLLQSRLSTQYMGQAMIINKSFFAPGMPHADPVPVDFLLHPDNRDALDAVGYVLNYFEFLSVGMRHGDLDMKVLRQTMRSIMLRLCGRMSLYIAYTRGESDGSIKQSSQFEHIRWLLKKWEK